MQEITDPFQRLSFVSDIQRGTPSTQQNNDHVDSIKSPQKVIFGSQEMIYETIHHQAQTIALLTQQLAKPDADPT